MKKLDARLGPIDHVLAALACLLAVYSIGMSLNSSGIATFFTVGILLTATSGYAIAKQVRGTKIANYDCYFWAVAGALTTGLVNVLNGLLPDEGFPFELLAAAVLCWLLLVGNLFAWRDQTLLFLSLPCIAIFGLVGTFDTFKLATVLFFLFMLTIALLYARIHQRAMIERAKHSGVDEPELLRRGPWKWMAGPEWALASALTIVMFSFMGGPVLQMSLKNVAGRVTVSLPQTRTPNNPGVNRNVRSDVRIGTGPVNLSDQLVFRVKVDMPRYFRLNSFSAYTGGGWSSTPVSLPPSSPLITRSPEISEANVGPNGGYLVWPGYSAPPQEPITDGRVIPFTVTDSQTYYLSLLSPGPIVEVTEDPARFTVGTQGIINIEKPLEPSEELVAYALVAVGSPENRRAVLPPALQPIKQIYLNKDRVPARVRDLAYRVTAEAETDFEKAMAIKREIEKRAKYNTEAAGIPRQFDPVDYFLFESQEGYCDLFASSMAVMARSVGLPTRYTIGYIVNSPERDEDGYFTIRGRDYHAWCEIYFEGLGWVAFDPTEGAVPVDGGERGGSEKGTPWYQSTAFKTALGGLVVIGLGIPVYLMLLRQARTPIAMTGKTVSEIARLHTNFNRAIEKHVGSPKRFSQTTREFVNLVGPKLGPASGKAGELVAWFEHAMFSPALPEKEEISEASAKITDLRNDLKKHKP